MPKTSTVVLSTYSLRLSIRSFSSWVVRSRSGFSSFTALALNKPSPFLFALTAGVTGLESVGSPPVVAFNQILHTYNIYYELGYRDFF